jgi:hypothetical protein
MPMNTNRDFATLLKDLLAESENVGGGAHGPATVSVDYLAVAEELLSGRIAVADETVAAVYREAAGGVDETVEALFEATTISAEPEPAPAELPPVEPEAISRELGLRGNIPIATLARIRRAFAFRNHPDRVAPHLRQRALQRMQVANMLIDDARRRAIAAARPSRG